VLLETPIYSDQSTFSLQPRWGRLGLRCQHDDRVLPPGRRSNLRYEGDPSRYALNRRSPRQQRTSFTWFRSNPDPPGFPAFPFALVLLFRRIRALTPFFALFALTGSAALIAFAYLPVQRAP